jgi:2-methylcitrate dehydratase
VQGAPAYAASADPRAVSLHILDTLCCALGAERVSGDAIGGVTRLTSGPPAAGLPVGHRPGATIWSTGEKTFTEAAALRNAASARYLDLNDTYVSRAIVHPSDLIAVLLAEAEASSLAWDRLAQSVAVGYELICRLADQADLQAHGFEASSLVPIAAAAAVSWLIGLPLNRMAEAVSISCLDAATLRVARSGRLSHWKALAGARGAVKGRFAAHAAAAGLRGPEEPFLAADGLFARVTGPLDFASGDTRARMPLVIIKQYPAQIFIQQPVALALSIRGELRSGWRDISEVRVRTFGQAVRMTGRPLGPDLNAETADHSLAFCVAAALVKGGLAPGDVHAMLTRAEVRNLAGRVRVEESAEFTSHFPASLPAEVTVVTIDGSRVTRSSDQLASASARAGALRAKFTALSRTTGWSWPWRIAGMPPADMASLTGPLRKVAP